MPTDQVSSVQVDVEISPGHLPQVSSLLGMIEISPGHLIQISSLLIMIEVFEGVAPPELTTGGPVIQSV